MAQEPAIRNFAKDERETSSKCLEIEAASEVRNRADSECCFVRGSRPKVKNAKGARRDKYRPECPANAPSWREADHPVSQNETETNARGLPRLTQNRPAEPS
jgi:hypothetical protein